MIKQSFSLRLVGAIFILAGVTVQVEAASAPKPSQTFIERKLAREGFSKAFVRAMIADYEKRKFTDVIELNVLLYLRKSDYHGIQVTPEAVREVGEFFEKNRSALRKAEKENRVPSRVIASLLWIESRHGKNTGDFHVPSVYLHLLQAPRTSVQKYLFTRTGRYTESITAADRKEIVRRTHVKAKWAVEELRALEKVYRWKWELGSSFRGSFSGAFGIPQFLPSSYVKWARAMPTPSSKADKQPNLSRADDSIMSVSYYLRDHGWEQSQEDSHIEALMKYNNSRDYANAILNLADSVKRGSVSKAERDAASVPATREAQSK